MRAIFLLHTLTGACSDVQFVYCCLQSLHKASACSFAVHTSSYGGPEAERKISDNVFKLLESESIRCCLQISRGLKIKKTKQN